MIKCWVRFFHLMFRLFTFPTHNMFFKIFYFSFTFRFFHFFSLFKKFFKTRRIFCFQLNKKFYDEVYSSSKKCFNDIVTKLDSTRWTQYVRKVRTCASVLFSTLNLGLCWMRTQVWTNCEMFWFQVGFRFDSTLKCFGFNLDSGLIQLWKQTSHFFCTCRKREMFVTTVHRVESNCWIKPESNLKPKHFTVGFAFNTNLNSEWKTKR